MRTHAQPFGSTNAIVQYQPDLVLLDVNMPGLSGEKLADVYRSNAKTREARVMLYSSNDEDTRRAGCSSTATSAKATPRPCGCAWRRCWRGKAGPFVNRA